MSEQVESAENTQARLMALSERSAQLFGRSFMKRLEEASGEQFSLVNYPSLTQAFQELGINLLSDPSRLAQAQTTLWRDSLTLWNSVLHTQENGGKLEPVFPSPPGDRRFKDKAWNEDPTFAYLQQSYLLMSNWLTGLVDKAHDLDPRTKQKLSFFMRQYVSAMAPSNFSLTNPEVIRRAKETNGQSIVDGLEKFLDDLERGGGSLKIRMTDEAKFEVGKNLASTPGKVVFRNEFFELIQYSPTTEKVHSRPLLIVPPWINKYYILDLQEKNSFVKWIVDQGHTVFLMSWVNATSNMSDKRFEDYWLQGPVTAMQAIEDTIGAKTVNILGFCIGGILTVSGLAAMAAKRDKKVHSATFLATMADMSDVGEISVFVDEAQVDAMEAHTREHGYLEGRYMADMFAMLRENDLIWSFFVNNYLMGREPMAFDLLYWNSDATRLPATMLSDYLRNFYLGNALAHPGKFHLDGVPIDTTKVTVPTYAIATRDDHIAPWKSCFALTRQFKGPMRFVLGGSGHIAGIVNPPNRNKYEFQTNDAAISDPDEWAETADVHPGSWWPDWGAWLSDKGGRKVAARDPSAGKLEPLCDAPGTYVLAKT